MDNMKQGGHGAEQNQKRYVFMRDWTKKWDNFIRAPLEIAVLFALGIAAYSYFF
jgi:hypothetical protein